jgi:uncharacterized protein (DUF3820 family)
MIVTRAETFMLLFLEKGTFPQFDIGLEMQIIKSTTLEATFP